MGQFWYTGAGRKFIEGTMPAIERDLDRIAAALETLTMVKLSYTDEDTILQYPMCEWCDHRHFPTAACLADDCECAE